MKKRMMELAAISMSVLMAASLGACGSSGGDDKSSGSDDSKKEESTASADESKGGDKEIVMWANGTEDPDKSIWNYAIDKYNEGKGKETGYQVSYVPTQNDTYKEKLVVAVSSGECPDIYQTWSGGPMIEYVEAGFGQPLDEYIDKYNLKDVLMDAALEQGTYNGKVYGLPVLNVAISGIYYNKDMFEQYNLEVPTTISDLEKVCDTLVENGITPFALANASKWTGSMYFMNLATRYGGLEPFQKAVSGEGTFEDESFVYAGEKIQEWVKKGYFPEGVNSLSEDDGQGKQLLYQDKAAMTCIGSRYTGTIKQDSEEFYNKLGWFPFPAVDGSSADASIIIGTIGDGFLTFNCTGEKLDAAFEMASYYFDDEELDFMVENGKIPPVKKAKDMITDPVSQQILEAATNASSVQLWYDQYLPPVVSEAHKDTCQELFGLTMTPEEANKELQKTMDEYNSSHNEE